MQTKLRMRILERGERQYVLASRALMSETRLSRILTGRIEPTAEERARMAMLLEAPESELFG